MKNNFLSKIKKNIFLFLVNKNVIKYNNNKYLLLNYIKDNASTFNTLRKDIKEDNLFIEEAITVNTDVQFYLNKEQKNKEVVTILLGKDKLSSIDNLSHIDDKDFVIEIIKKNPFLYDTLNDKFKNDLEIIDLAVKNNFYVFKSLPEKFKKNKEFIKKYVLNGYVGIFSLASEEIVNDTRFILELYDELKASKEEGHKCFLMYKYLTENQKKDLNVCNKMLTTPLQVDWIPKEMFKNKDLLTLNLRIDKFLFLEGELKEDKDFVISCVRENIENKIYKEISECLCKISKNLLSDTTFLSSLFEEIYKVKASNDVYSDFIYKNPKNISWMPQKEDKTFILKEISNNSALYRCLDLKFQEDPDVFLTLLNDVLDLKTYPIPYAIRSNKKSMLAAINRYGSNYLFCSDDLREDRDIVVETLRVAKTNFVNFIKMENYLEDKEAVICFLNNPIYETEHIPKNILDFYGSDKEVMILLAKKNFFTENKINIKHKIDESFLKDKDFVSALLSRNHYFLKDIDSSFYSDISVMKNSLNGNFFNYENEVDSFPIMYFALEPVSSDKDFIKRCVSRNPDNFKFVSDDLKENKDFILSLLDYDTLEIVNYIEPTLKNDKEFVYELISIDDSLFLYANEDLKNDKDFVLKLMENNCAVYAHLSDELKKDYEVILILLEMDEDRNFFDLLDDDLIEKLKNEQDEITYIKALINEKILRETLQGNKNTKKVKI